MNSPNLLRVTAPGENHLVLSRAFNAPARLVYRAWIDPAVVPRWLGKLRTWQMLECQIDARIGGVYRYVWGDAEGRSMAVTGKFIELVPGAKIVSSERFDDPWHEGDVIATVELSEVEGVTTATMTLRYDNRRVRDEVLQSNMAQGIEQSYAELDTILTTLA